jgi:hypothetical protein
MGPSSLLVPLENLRQDGCAFIVSALQTNFFLNHNPISIRMILECMTLQEV